MGLCKKCCLKYFDSKKLKKHNIKLRRVGKLSVPTSVETRYIKIRIACSKIHELGCLYVVLLGLNLTTKAIMYCVSVLSRLYVFCTKYSFSFNHL